MKNISTDVENSKCYYLHLFTMYLLFKYYEIII